MRLTPFSLSAVLLKRACISGYRHQCFGLAKGAAYSALLSLFPVLTTIAMFLLEANAEAVARILAGLLFQAAPPGIEPLLRENFLPPQGRPVAIIVSFGLVSLFAASGVMMTLMDGFRAAYGIPGGRPFFKQRAVAVLLVLCSAVPAILASAVILLGHRSEAWLLGWLGLFSTGEQLRGGVRLAGEALRYAVAAGTVVLVTSVLYYFGPNRPRRRWRDVLPGAVFATAFWVVATSAFGWYVRNVANYRFVYGSIAAVVTFLVWAYVLSVIALLGCEFNAQRELALARLGGETGPPSQPEDDPK